MGGSAAYQREALASPLRGPHPSPPLTSFGGLLYRGRTAPHYPPAFRFCVIHPQATLAITVVLDGSML